MIKFALPILTALLPCILAAADSAQIEQGKYLVEEVAKCGDCHTPMGEGGKPDTANALKGAMLTFQPVKEVKGWHKSAPGLTLSSRLWERWGDAGMLKFLTTGVNPNGHPAGPPMPMYKLKTADAEAIIAFLKSLP